MLCYTVIVRYWAHPLEYAMGHVRRLHGKGEDLKDAIKEIRRRRGNGRDTCPNCGCEVTNIFSKALKTTIRRCPQCLFKSKP